MNPFINLNKRSISLPPGCKDLIDVLNRPKPAQKNPIRGFIHLILMQAHQDNATGISIGVPQAEQASPPVRYKVGDTWYDLSHFPANIHEGVVKELQRMAGLPENTFTKEGIIDVQLTKTRMRWKMRMAAPGAECQLTRLDD